MNVIPVGLLVCFIFAVYGVCGQKQQSGFTKEEKQELLDLHNEMRAKVALGKQARQPQAANMVAMEWDDRLQGSAQRWASQCQGGHNSDSQRKFNPYNFVGQNYAGNYGIDKSVHEWYIEVDNYNYNSAWCGRGMCGHYTQLIWFNTGKVGCGWDNCKRYNKWSTLYCDYAPGGNLKKVGSSQDEQPYIQGAPCSKCPDGYGFCMGGALCASAKACKNSKTECKCPINSCENGGTFDKSTCSCKCTADWHGNKCEIPCKDTIDYCNSYKHECGYGANMWMWMSQVCQKSCGKCGPVKDPGAVNSDGITTNIVKHKH